MGSNIVDMFNSGTVLITGSTGFLGKLLTEKLLRSCKGTTNIAIIVRSKKGLTAEQRATNMYNEKMFDRLRKERPNFTNYIKVIDGELTAFSLGLSTVDHDWLVKNVNYIFHCAATLRFDEPIEVATKVNIEGTEQLLNIATQMEALKGFVHVSTAYSHCHKTEIKEQFYPTPISASELKQKIKLNSLSSDIAKDWPNTYTFTKAVTENLILSFDKRLPIAVFRPSIVGSTYLEPDPGHLENMNGPSGVFAGIIVGFLRVFPIKTEKITDLIPADYTVNALISTMWDTVNRFKNSNPEKPKIFNYVSSAESPLAWEQLINGIFNSYKVAPPISATWYYCFTTYTHNWFGIILRLLIHRIPAIVFDFILILMSKKPKFWKLYDKTGKIMHLLRPFTLNEWKFYNNNTRELWCSLSQEDQQLFPFSMHNFDWNDYTKVFYYGIRKHILHEEADNISMALKKNQKLFWLKQVFIFSIAYIVLRILWNHLFISK
ncbi:fatty acyl-CoA reductase wat-like [Adelges cooleyi]|uniref:fatty acyl-CoA reductase wat-like n=1 Tax=Adelges cooleyi TaxID=133065 RepID=UPI00217F9F27|nr:fatty acyl-CoA reductase wat-like [Adelges cooleyi]